MKVVHIISALYQGGAERQLDLLISESLDKNPNIEHFIVSLKDVRTPLWEEFEEKGIKVFSCEYSLIKFPLFLKNLYCILNEFDRESDVIQCWMYHADFFGGLVAKSLGFKKIFWNIRTTYLKKGSFLTKIVRQLNSKLSSHVPTKIVCVATASKNYHIECGYNKDKMVVIENGFLEQKVKIEREIIREKLGITSDTILVGSVGRYSDDKAQDLFIKAAGLVKSDADIKFILVGRGNNINNNDLIDLLHNENLQKDFILQDETKDVASYMNAMDIFCLHSRTEGFPNVLGEAMYLKLPCVTTNVGDALTLVGNNAIVSSDTSSTSIASALNEMLAKSPDERLFLGKAARERVIKKFSLENAHRKYINLYNETYLG